MDVDDVDEVRFLTIRSILKMCVSGCNFEDRIFVKLGAATLYHL